MANDDTSTLVLPPASEPPAELRADLLSEPFRLLIADDEEYARGLVEATFCTSALQMTFAKNGEEAIAACEQSLPDIAILDWQMPGKTGIEVCSWIKTHSSDNFVPVVLLTSQAEIAHKVHGLNCGADEYVTKPFAIDELEARVRALLRIKVLTDELRSTRGLLAEKEKQLVAMEVAGGAAHELGQPLTTLLLNCQLLQRSLPASPTQGMTAIMEAINTQCTKMRAILSQLNAIKSYKTRSYTAGVNIIDLDASTSTPDKRPT